MGYRTSPGSRQDRMKRLAAPCLYAGGGGRVGARWLLPPYLRAGVMSVLNPSTYTHGTHSRAIETQKGLLWPSAPRANCMRGF